MCIRDRRAAGSRTHVGECATYRLAVGDARCERAMYRRALGPGDGAAPRCPLGLAAFPPRMQFCPRTLVTERAVVHAQLQQMLVGQAHVATGTDPQLGHDLRAVQVGADGVDLLLGAQLRDAVLQIVVGKRESFGLAPCLLYTSDAADDLTRV